MGSHYVKRPAASVPSKSDDFQFLVEQWPTLAWFLAGRERDHADGPECPGSLILFFDSGRLKFCLSPKIGKDVAFGVVDDPTKPLDSVEGALVGEKIEWKQRR